MSRRTRVLGALLTLTLAAACSPAEPSGKYHRWFNPEGQPVQDAVPAATCSGEIPPPVEPPPPPSTGIPQGWRIATYTLMVDSMKIVNPFAVANPLDVVYQEYCIPVSLFVYVTGSGLAPVLEEFTDHGIVNHPLPMNALRYTPWRATLVVAWDPNSPAPVMNMDLAAKYEIGEGLQRAPAPTDGQVGLMCRLRQNGVSFSMAMSFNIFAPSGTVEIPGSQISYVNGPFVRCQPPAFSAQAA